MIAGTVFLIGLMLLITQLMVQGSSGEWPSITLASELALPADQVYSGVIVVDAVVRLVMSEVQLWTILVLAAALIYWLGDFTRETVGRLVGRPRPAISGAAQSLAETSPQS